MTGMGRSPLRGGLLFDSAGRPHSDRASAFFGQEYTSARVASLASRELNNPGCLSYAEISSLGGSVLSQVPPRQYAGAAAVLYGEQSSSELAALASKAMNFPGTLTPSERKSLAGSALTQTRNRQA